MSPDAFNLLTEKEKLFIRKEHENKFLHDMTWQRNAMFNAFSNANRKKNAKFVDLFPKKATKVDKEYNENAVETILAMEEENGKSWVDKVLKANGVATGKGGK